MATEKTPEEIEQMRNAKWDNVLKSLMDIQTLASLFETEKERTSPEEKALMKINRLAEKMEREISSLRWDF